MVPTNVLPGTKYSSFRSMYDTTTNYEDLTRYLLHLSTGLHAASNIKPSRIPGSKHYKPVDIKGCLIASIVRFVPFEDL